VKLRGTSLKEKQGLSKVLLGTREEGKNKEKPSSLCTFQCVDSLIVIHSIFRLLYYLFIWSLSVAQASLKLAILLF
jgi:hypothetical protein